MKYLLYYQDGLIKKFPLAKKVSEIGWSSKNDLDLKEEFISNFHLKVTLNTDRIEIEDLNSTNGTFVNGGKIQTAILQLNESFTIGGIDFFFKEGDLEEFTLAKELIPIFNSIIRVKEKTVNRKTRYEFWNYEQTIVLIMDDMVSNPSKTHPQYLFVDLDPLLQLVSLKLLYIINS